MTYSILARDQNSGALGIAVASRFFAVGAHVPHIGHNAAVATQAFLNPMWGVEGVRRLTLGENAEDVLSDFIKRDRGAAIRQAHMIDASGQSVAHTGRDCVDWAGHKIADGVSVAGNMLTGPAVISDTLACYLDHPDHDFPERLLLALEAGEAAGGDKRGRQAAALSLHKGEEYPSLDLRVDDHSDPLKELRRLYAVAQERAIFFAETFATADNFSGTPSRVALDRSIAEREAEWARNGYRSPSFATPEN